VLFDFRLLQHYLPGTDMGAIAVRQLSILAQPSSYTTL
jgi:hypothetical protein